MATFQIQVYAIEKKECTTFSCINTQDTMSLCQYTQKGLVILKKNYQQKKLDTHNFLDQVHQRVAVQSVK